MVRLQRRLATLGIAILGISVISISIFSLYGDSSRVLEFAHNQDKTDVMDSDLRPVEKPTVELTAEPKPEPSPESEKPHEKPQDRPKSPSAPAGVALEMHPDTFHAGQDANRHMGHDVWRPKGYVPSYPLGEVHRAPGIEPLQVGSTGEYMQQKLVADFAEGSDKLFLMLKTGATTFWKRMPIHAYTTLTRVPHFAIYSDHPDTIAGYEVIDILANTSQEYKDSKDFRLYRQQQKLRDLHNQVDFGTMKLDGGWELDKYKNIPMLQHAWDTDPNKDWYMFIDDDTYVFFDTLMDWLKELDHTEPLYMGSPTSIKGINFAHGGSGVVLSHGAMKAMFEAELEYGFDSLQHEYEEHTASVCCGDYMVAKVLLDKAKIKVSMTPADKYPYIARKIQGEPITTLKFFQDNWCQPITTFHHLSNRDIELMWQYERSKGPDFRKHITYQDLYHDFVKPYISDEIREDWTIEREDTDGDGQESSLLKEKEDWLDKHKHKDEDEDDNEPEKKIPEFEPLEDAPRQSIAKCKAWCESKNWCYQFVYTGEDGDENSVCKIKKYLSAGMPVTKGKKKRTGWNIGHIRMHLRFPSNCDELSGLEEEDAKGLDPDEGWWKEQFEADKVAQRLKKLAEEQEAQKLKQAEEAENEDLKEMKEAEKQQEAKDEKKEEKEKEEEKKE
ncbi:hypothetical protein CJU90_5791 [Yarrowia sp. C11]|nr:hypothetical protein CJU90_5791 [Yarrowia sp. C11]KAG5364370.1 hypothetical protein CKK34_3169 [Yarrowia sp. E02]